MTFSNADSVAWQRLPPDRSPGRGEGPLRPTARDSGHARRGDGRARIYEFQAYGKEGWQFAIDAEGWTPLSDISSFAVTDGKLELSASGSQPTIQSPDNLDIPASQFAALRVRMKNSGAPTSAKLSFATQADPSFSESKSVTVDAVASSPEYVDYDFDLSSNVAWTGTLRQLRLMPLQGGGDVSIDAIALREARSNNRGPVPPQGPRHRARVVSR